MSTKRKPAQSGRLTAGKKHNGANNNAITLGSQQVSHSQDDLFCGISATSRSGDSVDENFANSRLNDQAPGIVSPGVNSHNPPNNGTSLYSLPDKMVTKNGHVGIHHITGSFANTEVTALVRCLNGFLGQPSIVPTHIDYGRNRYDRQYVIEPFNVTVMYDSTKARNLKMHNGLASVSIPGKALDSLTPTEKHCLIKKLDSRFHLQCSRLDSFFDDFQKRISPAELNVISESGDVSGFRRCKYVGGSYEIGKPETKDGSGMYFGLRGKNGGGEMLRVYDKELETKGEVKAIRWELELSSFHAKTAFRELSRADITLKDFAKLLGGFVGGCIDFPERTAKPGEKNLPRLDRLSFWKTILDEIEVVKIRARARLSTIKTSHDWIEKSCASALNKVRLAYGNEYFFNWLLNLIDSAILTSKSMAQVKLHWQEIAREDTIPI